MTLYEKIIETYAELTDADFGIRGSIELICEADGKEWISKWESSKPIPDGLKLGK
jgi:hypothetical protein